MSVAAHVVAIVAVTDRSGRSSHGNSGTEPAIVAVPVPVSFPGAVAQVVIVKKIKDALITKTG